jgi:hypothetical protein
MWLFPSPSSKVIVTIAPRRRSGGTCRLSHASPTDTFARPCREVLRPVRRGIRDERSPGHPHPHPSAEGQRLRRVEREDRPLGMPGPRPRLRASASGSGPPCLRNHHTEQRPHRELDLATRAGMYAPPTGSPRGTQVARKDVLGGLIHECRWAARWDGILGSFRARPRRRRGRLPLSSEARRGPRGARAPRWRPWALRPRPGRGSPTG